MAVETLELRVVVSGGSQANSELQSISRSVSGMNDALRFMRSALVLLSFSRVFAGLFEAVNAFQQMYNKLRLVTNSSQEAQQAQITLAKAAIQTRASYEDTVNVFAALARSTKALNLDYGQILSLSKEWNQSIVVSGVDQQQSRNALKDFIEELNLGVIQGRQLRALLMQNPEFLRLMAEGMSKVGTAADPWFAAVKKATEGGKALSGAALFEINKQHPGSITSSEAIKAVMLGADEEAKKFNQTQTTIGQAFTNLKTKAEVFFATLTQSTGALDWLKQGMSWIGDHLDVITEAVAAFAGLLIINTVTGAFVTFGGTASSMFGLLFRSVSNLYLALGNVLRIVGLVTAAFGGWGAVIIVLGALIIASFWKPIQQAFGGLNQYVQQSGGWFAVLINILATVGAAIQTVMDGIVSVFQATWGWLSKYIGPIIDVAEKVVRGTAAVVGTLATAAWNSLPSSIKSALGSAATGVEGDFSKHFSANQAALAKLASQAQGYLGQFNLNNMKGDLNLAGRPPGAGQETVIGDKTKDLTAKVRAAEDSIAGLLSRFGGPLAKFNKDWVDLTTTVEKATAVLGPGKIGAMFAAAGFDDFNAKTGKSLELMKAMERESLGLKNANLELSNTERMINKALQDKAISQEESIRLDTAAKIAALSEAQGSVNAGVQIAALKYNQTLMDQNKIAEEVVASTLKDKEALATLTIQYQALSEAVKAGVISADDMASKLRDLQIAYLNTQTDMESGFVKGMLDVQKSMDDVATTAAGALENSFKSLQDTLVEFFDTGKLNVKKFADEVLGQFTRVAVQSAIMQPLTNLLGFGPGQTSGSSPTTGFLSQIFGGTGALPGIGGGAPGSDPTNPMWVQMVGIGTTIGSLPGLGGGGGAGGGGSSGLMGLFNQGGVFGSGGFVSNLFNGGGGAGSASSGILDAFSSIGSLFGFAEGTDFLVGGKPGTDANLVAFRASNDERVTVQTPAQQRAASRAANSGRSTGDMHLHLHGVQDVDSFRRSRSQVAAGMSQIAEVQRRRNGS